MRPAIAALIAAALSASPARADSAATARAEAALADLTRAFWVGTPDTGHLRDDAISKGRDIGGWGPGQAVMAYYGAWKYLGDATAGQRVAAEWLWMKNGAPKPADLSACGPGVRFNFASDDTGWDAGLYLQAYEVSHDPAALTAAAGSLDCAWRTWWDSTFGGGYWYDQRHSDKMSYQAVLALDCEWLFRLTGNKQYQQRAIAAENWMAARLGRPDGLYWKTIMSNGKHAGEDRPYLIEPTHSVTMLVGNMAEAVLDMWLYQDTGQTAYLQRPQTTAAGILKYEVDKTGVLIDDQDGFTDGWAMAPFVHDVVLKLPAEQTAAWAAMLQRSATSVLQMAHYPNGTFGADWAGPLEGGAWARNGKTIPSNVSVSGGAVNIIVAAALF